MAKKTTASRAATGPVLIVEDDDQMRALLKSLAASLGCRQITDVGSFERAAERLEHHVFALAIIDLHLGHHDGVKLIEMIRSAPRTDVRTMPILAASTRSSNDRILAAVAAGADGFLRKPFSILNLQRQIQFACDKADQRRSADDFFEID